MCSQVCEEVLRPPVQVYREAQDGGQDAVFLVDGLHGAVDARVQCKHASDPHRRLKESDLTAELEVVTELVARKQADTYYLMTSMGVDAPIALKIRARLRTLGVRKPHVLGREYLVRTIRGSARLRALVPQVYGLGDLAAILDQRLIQRTRMLLDHWIPKLKLYVPTSSHRKAVVAEMVGDPPHRWRGPIVGYDLEELSPSIASLDFESFSSRNESVLGSKSFGTSLRTVLRPVSSQRLARKLATRLRRPAKLASVFRGELRCAGMP